MQGVFQVNSRLKGAVRLFEGQIHGPGVRTYRLCLACYWTYLILQAVLHAVHCEI
jgi:hypothetical protein